MEYPSTWDKTNTQAVAVYEKCRKYYKEDEEEKFVDIFIPSVFSRIFFGIVLYYCGISLVLIIIERNSYKKMKCSILICLLFSIGSLINMFNFYYLRVNYKYLYINIY